MAGKIWGHAGWRGFVARSSHVLMAQEAESGQEREGLYYDLNYKGSAPHELHLLARPSLSPNASITS